MVAQNLLEWLSPEACIIKLSTAEINSVTKNASVFVNVSKKWLTITEALAEFITAQKSFIIEAPGVSRKC